MADSIQELMNKLGAMSYSSPSSYKGYQSQTKNWHVDRTMKNMHYNFSQKDLSGAGSKPKVDAGVNLWDMLSGTIGQPVGLITTALSKGIGAAEHAIHDKNEPLWKKIWDLAPNKLLGDAVVQGTKAGAKEQYKDWHDGKLSWGDAGAGFLHGMDKGWDRGNEIAANAGVKNKWAQMGIGLGIDTIFDPLTYLTGGLSAASKASKVAEMGKVKDLAQGLGMTGKFKNSGHFLETVTNSMKDAMMKKYPNVTENVIDKTVSKKVAELADQIKTAKNTTYNAHVNDWGFAVPFTNKFGKVGTYGAKNLMHNSEALVPQTLVNELLQKASMGSKDLQPLLEEAVKARYGVDHTGQLSKTMFDDLHEMVQPIIHQVENGKSLPHVDVTQEVANGTFHAADFGKIMDKFVKDNVPWKDVQKQIEQIMTQTNIGKHAGDLRSSYGADLAKMVKEYWEKAPVKNFNKVANARKAESMGWAERLLRDSEHTVGVDTHVDAIHPHGTPEANAAKDTRVFNKQFSKMVDTKYNEMGDFKSNIGHFFDKHNPFDARTLATGDKFVNSMGNHISDAHSQQIGETARYTNAMNDIQKFVSKLPEGDKQRIMNEAIYTLEGHAPDALGGDKFVASSLGQELANKLKPVIDRMGEQETGGDVLSQLRKNYFPHVVNSDAKDSQAIEDFMKRNGELNGKSSKSVYDKERKSFQTLAQRDNYLAKMEKAIQKETDPAKKASLQAQQDRVSKMFDTDVVSALQRRIKTGVRAKAMKEMQGNLSKYGMMKSITKDSGEAPPSGLTKLSKDEAKKMGLDAESTHYMHPDVLKGMKKVDEIFTTEGMNKLVRTVSAISDVWRPLVTYYKPTHYVNNILGNVMNNMAAGVKINDYRAAIKLLAGYRKGTLTKAQMDIIDSAYKHNVISGGFLYDAHQTYKFSDPTKLEKAAKAIGENKVIKGVRKHAGEKPDDWSRLANYINGLNKYGKPSMAAKQVRTYLFNYNEMTNMDRNMRVLVPFWNWTKRNLPLQSKLLLQNPKYAMGIERFKQFFNQDEQGADWQKDTGIKVPFTNYYTTVPSPTQDLEMMTGIRPWLGSMAPAIRMPIELGTNQRLSFGTPISYGSKTPQAADLLKYFASNAGLGGNVSDALSGKRGTTESIINLFKNISPIKNQ